MAGLTDLLAARAGEEPDALAFFVDGADGLTYLAWERRSNAIARGLLQRGVRRGDRVVLCFDTRQWVDYAIAAAGAVKVAAVAVPIGAHRTALDRAAIAAHCGATAIVGADGIEALADGQPDSPLLPARPVETAEILYPYGHLRPLRPILHSEEEILSVLPGQSGSVLHAFAVGSNPARLALWAPLGPGGPTVVTLGAIDPERLCALTEERGVDRWWLVPATALLVAESGAVGRHHLSSLRAIDLVGSPPSASVLSRLTSVFGDKVNVSPASASPSPASSQGTPPRQRPAPGAPGSGPERSDGGDAAEIVAAVFERVLDVDRIGADDDFFAMGGDEMAALRALDLLEDALGRRLRLDELVGSPTVSALAARLERRAVIAPGAGGGDDGSPSGAADVAPVAFSQEGMLWQEQFVPGSQNLPPLVRRFHGPLDVGVLEAALDEIVRRHEPLRSRFELRAGRPVQVVAAHERLSLPVRDLSGMAPAAQEAELAAALAHARRPFDLAAGPLFEAALFRFAADDHVVVFRVHHSVYDDWSVSVFRRELSALYTAYADGEPSPLPEPAIGFAEFSRAQHRRLAGPAGTAQLRWWKAHLAGAPFCLQLPVDDPDRVEGSSQRSAEPVTVEVPAELSVRVRALARRQRATSFMTMLAAFQVLVHRYTDQTDLLMASVVANRNRPELEPMIGCFTKKILLRQDMAGDPTFAEVLDRTRTGVLGALPHQDLPFETVLQETVGPAAAAHGLVPYVGVMFQGVTPQTGEVVLPGVTTTGYDTSTTTTRAHFAAGADDDTGIDNGPIAAEDADSPDTAEPWGGGLYLGTFVILSLVESPDAVSLVARGAFDRPAVERLLANLVSLLGEIVDDPGRRLSQLRVLAHDERRHLMRMGNVAAGDQGQIGGRCALELFREQAERTPSLVAVRSPGGELTYAGLRARADALAARLAVAGAGWGSLVGICLEASERCVVAVLAVWATGAGYVALDPTDDVDHLAFVVADASLDLIVTGEGLGSRLPASARLIEVEGHTGADADADCEGVGPAPAVITRGAGHPGPGDTALVFYGSGTSALPRAVVIEHRSVVNLAIALHTDVYGVPSTGRRVWQSALPTDDAFVRQMTAVLGGHTLTVAELAGERQRQVVALVASGDVDVLDGAAEDVAALVGTGLQKALLARPADAVTPIIIVASRQGPDERLRRTLRALRRARACVLYGPPECAFAATADCIVDAGRQLGTGERATVGRPLGHVSTRVLGPHGHPVPVQVTGELYLGGQGLARGYVGPPRATDGFVTLGVAGEPQVRLFRTGQRARYLPDGRIELLGAAADNVGFRGFSVDLSRLEAALARCPGVGDVRVVVDNDDAGCEHLVAYLVPGTGALPTQAQLRVWLWSQHPGCAWPAAVEVVADTGSPGGTGTEGYPSTPALCGPALAEEAFLAALWAETAGVDRVGPEENYWQSFPFLDVVTRAAEVGVGIKSHQVTRNRTIATLAADLAAGRRQSLPR